MLYYVISLRLILVYHTRTVSNDSVKVIQYLRLQQFYKCKVRFFIRKVVVSVNYDVSSSLLMFRQWYV